MKLRKLAVAVLASTALPVFATAITTDIIAVVDESGSMGGEHAWISGMMTSLDTALGTAAGGDPFSPTYGLVGFGGGSGHTAGHTHLAGGTIGQFTAATGGLLLNGGLEDGYSGMSTALGHAGQGGSSVRNLILVTDEDRDNFGGPSKADMTAALAADKALLNAVINVSIHCNNGQGPRALGVDSSGTGYVADGLGGFTTCADAINTGGFGTSWADYGTMALGTGGAAWDLNQLRAGGLTAASFTAAFVEIKVQETINATEPGTLGLLGLGLAGLAWVRKKINV